MKHFFLFILGLFVVTGLYSQPKPTAFPDDGKGVQGDWGLTFEVNGLIDAVSLNPSQDFSGNDVLSLRYFWKDQAAFRIGLGIDGFNKTLSRVDSISNTLVEYDSTSTRFDFFINPSYEHHFTRYTRLDPFIGVGMNFGFLGKRKQRSTQVTSDTTGSATREFDATYPGGFQFGIIGTFGFNYFVARKFSFGVEYRLGFYTRKIGGDFNEVIIDTPITGQRTVNRSVGSNLQRDTGFELDNQATVTLSYFFSKNK